MVFWSITECEGFLCSRLLHFSNKKLKKINISKEIELRDKMKVCTYMSGGASIEDIKIRDK